MTNVTAYSHIPMHRRGKSSASVGEKWMPRGRVGSESNRRLPRMTNLEKAYTTIVLLSQTIENSVRISFHTCFLSLFPWCSKSIIVYLIVRNAEASLVEIESRDRHYMYIITSAKEVKFSSTLVGLFVSRITRKLLSRCSQNSAEIWPKNKRLDFGS